MKLGVRVNENVTSEWNTNTEAERIQGYLLGNGLIL